MVKEHVQKLSSALWQLQRSGRFCDTVLVVSGNVEIQAHAAVLAATSVQLCAMLQQNQSDDAQNRGTCPYYLDVIDYDMSTVAALLEFIYIGEMRAFTSLTWSSRNHMIELCMKFGITVTDNSADNMQFPKNTTDCPSTESTRVCKSAECHSDAGVKVEIAAVNSVAGTDRDCTSCGVVSLQPELTSGTCVNDHTVTRDCSSGSRGVVRSLSSEVKFQVDREPAGKVSTFGKNDSAARMSSSSKGKKVRRKRISGRTRLALEQPLTCSNCRQTFSERGSLLDVDGDPAEKPSCPHCQHPCVQAAEVTGKSHPSEGVVKTEDGCTNVCSTVDESQPRPECTDPPAQDQKQESEHKQSATAPNLTDGKSSRRWHRCTVCSRHYSTASALQQHQRVHAEGGSQSTLASCRTCGKKFRHMSYLRCHERLHEGGDRPFVCDVCGKGFIGSSNLTTHRRTHTGERPYACSVCHKRFLQLCAVREHEKIHVGIKMFVCDVCGKQFLTHAQLYNHSRTHGGEKSFECKLCKKRFYTNGDLVKHARIHGDQRPFVCDVCGKGFKYSSNLHGHARIHTGSRPFPCQTCGKAFTYSSHLTRHAKMHTRNNVVLDDATTAVKDELPLPPVVTQSIDSIVAATGTTPSAILLVRPELLIGGSQVATNILSGFPIGTFSTRLCN